MAKISLFFGLLFFVLIIGSFRSSEHDEVVHLDDASIERLLLLLDNYNVRTVLNIIARCEGTALKSADASDKAHRDEYTICFGYDRVKDFDCHPSEKGFIKEISLSSKVIKSTAAGRYQFLFRTWRRVFHILQITSLEKKFSPVLKKLYSQCDNWYYDPKTIFPSYHHFTRKQFNPFLQDLAAVYLLHEQGVLKDIIAGNFHKTIYEVSKVWASIPKDESGQSFYPPQKARPYNQLLKDFNEAQKKKSRYKMQKVL